MPKPKSPFANRVSLVLHLIRGGLEVLWSIFAFVVIGGGLLGLLYFVGGRDFYQWISAKRWIETQCTIQSASLHSEESSSEDGGTQMVYRVDTTYWFLDETEVIYGDRYDFTGGMSSSGFGDKSRAVRYLKNNPTVPCYYNPRNTDQSVIDRGFRTFMLFMFIPLVFLVMFALIAFGALKGLFTKGKPKRKRSRKR